MTVGRIIILLKFSRMMGAWPIDHDSGIREFRYRAFVPGGTYCKGVPTWNYFVQKVTGCGGPVDYDFNSIPPGASLVLPGDTVPKCDDIVAVDYEVLVKWNPALNCGDGNEVVFSILTDQTVPTSCGNLSLVTTKIGCDGGYLLGPGCGVPENNIPAVQEAYISTDQGPIKVTYAACGGAATTITDAATGAALDPVPAYICSMNDNGNLDCYRIQNAGPQSSGCVIYANPTYYLYGADAYRR